ncbi:hypothetical protein K439DRAFT_1358404 [Ramaria rubella]|nr:hypothetical protein K439DRAFT_1358404 [Ramaria rubella]
MYRGPSPIFDVPEFPPLRRVKPLPKRRRTSGEPLSPMPDTVQYTPGMMPADAQLDMASFGLSMPLPQYYMPMLNGVQDLFRMSDEDRSLEYPGGFAVPVGAADEEDHGDGDYVDHLQQPGNTKKRKVPAAHHTSADELSSPIAAGDDEPDEHGSSVIATGRVDSTEVSDVVQVLTTPTPPLSIKKNRTSAATLAGLQHKELLKTRKRQLAAVLGALSHGDTLALDQALSARYSGTMTLSGQNTRAEGKENDAYDRPRRRWSRRRTTGWEVMLIPDRRNMIAAPTAEFTFLCPSPTSERLISTREEVAILHSRFEAELSRQAAKAAEAVRQNALAMESISVAKRDSRNQQRSRSSGTITGPNSNNGLTEMSGTGAKPRTSKKKKRSALANASNPHHLRNYVPSRIPHSGQTAPQGAVNNQNLVSPSPTRFLAAEIAPRRRKKTAAVPAPSMAPPLNPPEDEWICALCEYNLFYGADTAFRRAVRSRKKILVRRRRARERAAAAASGQKPAAAAIDKSTSESVESPLEEEYSVGEGDGHKPVKHGIAVSKKERDRQTL